MSNVDEQVRNYVENMLRAGDLMRALWQVSDNPFCERFGSEKLALMLEFQEALSEYHAELAQAIKAAKQ